MKLEVCTPVYSAEGALRVLRREGRRRGGATPAEERERRERERRRFARSGPDLFGHGYQRDLQPFGVGPARELCASFCAEAGDAAPKPRTMIVVAHQDDEVIGAGARLMRLGSAATIVHVTDGAPRDVGRALEAGFRTREEYGEARRREVLSALALAGIGEEGTRTLGFVDTETVRHLRQLVLRLVELIEQERPELLVTHSYEGGHTDHDSTAFAVQAACDLLRLDGVPIPPLMELTSYHNQGGSRTYLEFLPWSGGEVWTVPLGEEAQARKRELFRRFRTQWHVLRRFPLDRERFREAPRYDFSVPPHPGTLDYERFGHGVTGQEWRTQAMRALKQLGLTRWGSPITRTSSRSGVRLPLRVEVTVPEPALIVEAPAPGRGRPPGFASAGEEVAGVATRA